MAITADRILKGVKRRAVLPTNQNLLDDDDMLEIIDDNIKAHVIPLIDSVNGEFFVTSTNTAIVASQDNYAIPYRSIGRAIRDLKIIDTDTGNVRNSPYIEPEDVHLFADTALNFGHYFKGDEIYLVPSVPSTFAASESLQIWYKLRPSALTKLTNAAKVTSVSSPTVEVASVGNVATGSVVDFIAGKSGNSILNIDKTCTNVSGTTLTFAAADIPSGLAVGDYISLAGTSPVITMIPDEVMPFLERISAAECLATIGDEIGASNLSQGVSIERKNLLSLLQPRNEGEPKIIINRNSLARGSKFKQRRYLYGGS